MCGCVWHEFSFRWIVLSRWRPLWFRIWTFGHFCLLNLTWSLRKSACKLWGEGLEGLRKWIGASLTTLILEEWKLKETNKDVLTCLALNFNNSGLSHRTACFLSVFLPSCCSVTKYGRTTWNDFMECTHFIMLCFFLCAYHWNVPSTPIQYWGPNDEANFKEIAFWGEKSSCGESGIKTSRDLALWWVWQRWTTLQEGPIWSEHG